jgi:hypothetical protein
VFVQKGSGLIGLSATRVHEEKQESENETKIEINDKEF